jgi:hypothetical protein
MTPLGSATLHEQFPRMKVVHVLPRVHVALAVPETVNLAEICLPLTTVPVTSAVEHCS